MLRIGDLFCNIFKLIIERKAIDCNICKNFNCNQNDNSFSYVTVKSGKEEDESTCT